MRNLMLALMVVSMLISGCAKKEAPPEETGAQPEEATGDAVRQKVLSFNLEGLTEKGAKKWDVKGEAAEAISESEIRLDNIVANTYGDDAQATITADKGIYDKAKNNVKLEKNVRATIDSRQGTAGEFMDFAGVRQDASKPETAKRTKTIIACDGEAQFNYEENVAYFSRNVKVTSDDGTIDADKITMYLDRDSKKVSQILCEGNVKITRGENIVYGDKATYIEADKKVVLSGSPKLVIYQEGEMGEKFFGK